MAMNQQFNEFTAEETSTLSNDDEISLTRYQSVFYITWLKDPLNADFNMVLDQCLKGSFDIDRFNSSMIRLVNDYLLINSNVIQQEDNLYWKRRDLIKLDFKLINYFPNGLNKQELAQLVLEPFDLEKDLLFRFNVIRYSEFEYRLVYVMPHILIDGLSTDFLMTEFTRYYNDDDHIKSISIDEQAGLHRVLNSRLNTVLEDNKVSMDEFWQRRLNGVSGVDLGFLKDYRRSYRSVSKQGDLNFSFSAEELSRVKQLSRTYRLTPYIYGQLIYGMLLHRMTGQQSVGIIFPVAILEGMDLIYGAHVNMVILDFFFDEQTTLSDLINRTLSFFDGLKKSKGKYHPVNELLKYLENDKVFDVAFVQANLRDARFDYQGITEISEPEESLENFASDLLFEQELRDNQLNYRVRYDNTFLDDNLVKEFVNNYKRLFNNVLEDLLNGNSERRAGDYTIVQPEAYKLQVDEWNQTQTEYTSTQTLIALFEEQAANNPEAIALICGDRQMTYRELNTQANRLAHYLCNNYNITADDLIVLCLDRSEYLLIGILGVLKSGGAYVPVDPGSPAERMGYVLEDTQAKAVLTNEVYRDTLQGLSDIPVMTIDSEAFGAGEKELNLINVISVSHLAHVIYTSGTTGNPKGVMIEHASFIHTLNYSRSTYFDARDKLDTLSVTNYVFDLFGLEYGLPLISGGSITLSDHDFAELNTSHYKFIQITPGLLSAKLDQVNFTNPDLKLFVGGEALPASLLDRLFAEQAVGTVVNIYGPAETTIWSLNKVNTKDSYDTSIGRPISNTSLYVLDQYQYLLPVGCIGELYIGGIGVSRGYLNRKELTRERFIANPFQTEEEKAANYNGILYKTGDLVRYRADGHLEYIGRNDFQVKIRGHRIELGEIETRMNDYGVISQTLVQAYDHTSGTKYLVGYYVAEATYSHEELNSYLSSYLPDYMLPSVYVHMDSLPLTANGKLDRRSLPIPGFSDTSVYHAPETALEQILTNIWSEVLGLPVAQISATTDFFRFGGNSIMAIKLANRINKLKDGGVSVTDLFRYKTIRELADYLSGHDKQEVMIDKIVVNHPEEQLLSYAQERLWFIEEYSGGSHVYNMPLILRLSDILDIALLEKAIIKVISRHEVLRTQIRTGARTNVYQHVLDPELAPLSIIHRQFDSRELLEAAMRSSVYQVFRLSEGYPISVNFYSYGIERYFCVVVHHTAFDGWSLDVIIREVLHYYKYYKGEAGYTELPALSLQYKDYALWQRSYLRGEVLKDQLHYWLSRLEGYKTLFLPTDHVRPLEQHFEGADVIFELDEQTSADLRTVAGELGVSLYSLLLSGYYLLLQGYSGQDDIIVGTAVSNRHHRQTQDMIGFFVNTLALRFQVDNDSSLEEFITSVGRMVEEAQGYQDLPFERLVEALKVDKDMSRHPLFQVMFSMDNFRIEEKTGLSDLFFPYTGSITYAIAKFDLNLTMSDYNKMIHGNLNYATSLFEESTINLYINTYKEILGDIASLIY